MLPCPVLGSVVIHICFISIHLNISCSAVCSIIHMVHVETELNEPKITDIAEA